MVLAAYLKEHSEAMAKIKELDLFNVNRKIKSFVKELFNKYKIGISSIPYNYMVRDDIKN
jgi:hypothetical protein